MADTMPQYMSKGMPDRLPDKIADRMSKILPHKMAT